MLKKFPIITNNGEYKVSITRSEELYAGESLTVKVFVEREKKRFYQKRFKNVYKRVYYKNEDEFEIYIKDLIEFAKYAVLRYETLEAEELKKNQEERVKELEFEAAQRLFNEWDGDLRNT